MLKKEVIADSISSMLLKIKITSHLLHPSYLAFLVA